MKKLDSKLLLVIIAILILSVSCSKEGLFIKGSVDYYADGSISKGKLIEDSIIEGYPVISWIHFYENGKLKQFDLSENFSISNLEFPKGSTIFLNSEGIMVQAYLSKDLEIQGYKCPGGNLKEAVGFYPSGKLRFFFPKTDVLIDGVPCKGGGLHGIWLYETYKKDGRIFKEGDEIRFDDKK